jgi:endonuclease/exonuclease/phosphatase family metal-dependent hydrolase
MKLRVVSLNLWNGGRLMDAALDFLEAEAADIVLLQEVYNGTDPSLDRRFRSMEVLQERLQYPHAAFAPAMLDTSVGDGIVAGSAMLAKYPIAPAETVFFNEPFHELDSEDPETFKTMPRTLQHVTLALPAGSVDVFNVHGVWDLAGDNFGDRRRRMRESIVGAIEGKQRVILGGDTNAQPTNPMWQAVEQRVASVFGSELKSTFNMKHKTNPGYATARVDMLFLSPSIKVIEHQCHDVDVSDHLPLTATVEIVSP